MKTSRLSKSIRNALNTQMTREAHASQIYLSYASWAKNLGYDGVAHFLFRHAHEERNHMMKILEYILQRGEKVVIEAIPGPPADPKTIQDCFEKVFEHEIENTKGIYKLVKISLDEEDWATWNFSQWFVKEQLEEETLAMSLLDKVKIAGGKDAKPDALYTLDRDLEKLPDEAAMARDATEENPV